MTRKLCTGEAEARADLGAGRSRPAWLSSRHALPFQDLSDDEFEVFCYLLLLHEHPDERIIYHGKTGDAGRDIVRTMVDGTVELIQCKRYTRNVGVGEVRKELAKHCANVHRGVIPVRPTRVAFYAVPDLTNPAKDLLAAQAEWLKVCDADLETHLGEPPSAEMTAFARSWWPQFEHEEQYRLTRRADRFQQLIDEFFAVRHVVTGSLDEIRPELKSLRQMVESIYGPLTEVFGSPQIAESEAAPPEAIPAGALSAPSPAQQALQVRVLTAKIGFLEEQERRHLDEKGQRLWEEIQQAVRELNLRQAVEASPQLVAWLDDEGRKASASVRGRAAILLADLTIIGSAGRNGDDRVDVPTARRWYERAFGEFGSDISPEDAGRLASLEAKLLFLEGRPDDALRALRDADDPASLNVKLSIFLEKGAWEDVIQSAAGKPLHERWCDRVVLAHAFRGAPEEAKQVVAWAKKHSDFTTHRRCLLAFAQGALGRLLRGRPTATPLCPVDWDEAELAQLRDVVATLRPILTVAEANGRAVTGMEAEGLGLAVVTTRLLGERGACATYCALLATAEPVSLEFARSVLRGDVDPPADLADRLRRDHPELLDAHVLAAHLEADRPGQGEQAFAAALGLTRLADTPERKERVSTLLLELAPHAGPEALVRAEHAVRELLGDSHPLVAFVQAAGHLQAGRAEDAAPLVEACRSVETLLWLQLSACLKQARGDLAGALDDLVAAGRLLPHPEILEKAASLAVNLRREDAAEEALGMLVRVAPHSRRGWWHLAVLSVRLGRHGQAARCFRVLRETEPDQVAHGVNEARALALAGRKQESLGVYDAVCQRHPHVLEALGGRAHLLEVLGRPDEAFRSLDRVREQFWCDQQFLLLYMWLGYKARREQEAQLAFQRLLELQRDGQDGPLRGYSLDEIREMFRQHHRAHEERNRDLLVGRAPWLLVGRTLGRPAYADWTHRTQELIVPDDPHGRAEFTVYSTNGWTVRQMGEQCRSLEPLEGCPPAGQPVVADLTALITLHRLGLLAQAASYFGKILIPASYGALALEEQADLQPHQPVVLDALQAVREAADAGHLLPAPAPAGASDGPVPALLDEHADEEAPGAQYVLVDVISWLHRTGQVGEERFAELHRTCRKPSSGNLPPVEDVAPAGFVTTVPTLRTAFTVGLLPSLLDAVRLFLPAAEFQDVRQQLRAAQHRDEVARWHRELWDFVLQDPRFEQVRPRRSTPSKKTDEEGDEDADVRLDSLVAAPLLAGERQLPLLADDRSFQMILLNGRPNEPHAAFGTDGLLEALAEAGHLSEEGLAGHFVQLIRWRYRFLVPPVRALVALAAQHRAYPPGEPLREVSRYVHDCLRDPGLLAGAEPTTPPTSVAWKTYQRWVQHVGGFLMHVWHDPRFDDRAATAFTRWAVGELLPSPPRALPRAGIIVACHTTTDQLLSAAFAEIWHFRNPERSNQAIAAIAEALGLSCEEYLDVVAAVVEADGDLPAPQGAEDAVRCAWQLLAHTAIAHLDTLHARSFFAMQQIGFVHDPPPFPSPAQLAAVADPDHPLHVATCPGPFVFVSAEDGGDHGQALCVRDLLLHPGRDVREAAVRHFLRAPAGPSTWLSPRSRSALTEYAGTLRSDVPGEWLPAARRVCDILEDDFLLNLAGFRQSRQVRLPGEQEAYWGKVLRPGLALFASVPPEWYGIPSVPEGAGDMDALLKGATSLAEALDRYFERYGHLPLCRPRSAGTLLRRWVEMRGDTPDVWDQVWAWASASPSPLRRYHACQAFLECPALVPEGGEEALWAEVGQILHSCQNDADPEDAATQAWRLYGDLARHYLGQLDLHTADQLGDRLAALAWWAAERVAQAACESILAEEDEGGTKRRLRQLLGRCVSPEADLTESMAGFAPSGTSLSPFSVATRKVCGLWGDALLGASARTDSANEKAVLETYEAEVALTLLGACLSGFPPVGGEVSDRGLASDGPLEETAARWLSWMRTEEHRRFLAAALEFRQTLADDEALVGALRRLPEAEVVEQVVICNTFSAAGALGRLEADLVWEVASNEEWARAAFGKLEASSLYALCEGLLELQRRAGGKWHWALPHFFGSLTEALDVETERRRLLALTTIRSSVVGGGMSAVRRLLGNSRQLGLQNSLRDWRAQLEELRDIAPPVVRAVLRDVIACLGSLQGKAG